MGAVSSRPDDGASLVLRDQNKFSVTSVKITNSRRKVLYEITPNAFPATRFSVARGADDDDAPIEYIQDPDSPTGIPNFLLRLGSNEDVYFYFTFVMRQPTATSPTSPDSATPAETVINSLTFLFASTSKELETLVTREFNADPNLHKNPNVELVGDYSTAGNAVEQFEWSWKWRPPKPEKDKGGGWRASCSFVEYNQRAHKLNSLVSFSFWMHGNRSLGNSPKSATRYLEPLPSMPRIRVPSSHSMDSRLSDSDTETNNAREPISPYLEPTILEDDVLLETPSNAIKVDIAFQRPGEDVSAVEDGPVFRATMRALEQKTGNMRTRMKQVIKRAEAAKDAQVLCNRSLAAFMEALREASSSNANAVQPALDHYFEKIATQILEYDRQNAENLQRLIIDPMSRFYSNDIKQVDSKKKDFEEESKEYYAYVGRYLGQRQDSIKDKKKAENESKYQTKRRNFELKRFDYSSFMQDLHGGRKDQEVLSQLTKYADAQARGYLETAKKVEGLMPQLDALVAEVREADKEYQLIRTGREEKRRTLEKGPKYGDLDDVSGLSSATTLVPSANRAEAEAALEKKATPAAPAVGDSLAVPPPKPDGASPASKFKGYRDLEDKDCISPTSSQQRREGLLWSLGQKGGHYTDPKTLNKQAWHKYWIVLDQGRLSEYVNWRDQLEQNRDPIDLRVASVREARNAERRFCFEVITPNSTRVYQAQSEDEVRAWIQAINNALQTAFETRSNLPDQKQPSKGASMARDLFGKSSSYHGHRSASSAAANNKTISRHATVGVRPPISRHSSNEDAPARLLQAVRDADAGNAWCADCTSDIRTEWVSLNLGIVVCIECSGIHRSLGTHVSKIRSLTLDTVSFTQDTTELLLLLGNRVSNMVWEATLDRPEDKPAPNASREHRLRFITNKYAKRAYVAPHPTPPNDLLLASIKTQNLPQVVHALALGASPNAADRSRATAAVYLALTATDPAMPGGSSPNSPTSPASPAARKSFPMAELLLQNGADIPATPPPVPLGQSAWLYLEYKKSLRLPRGGLAGAGGSPHNTPEKRIAAVAAAHAAAAAASPASPTSASPASASPGTSRFSYEPLGSLGRAATVAAPGPFGASPLHSRLHDEPHAAAHAARDTLTPLPGAGPAAPRRSNGRLSNGGT